MTLTTEYDSITFMPNTTRKSKKSSAESESASGPFEIGKAYFIRTVTYHLTGRVTAIVDGFLLLSDAAWIADSGRFMQALRDGTLNEVEPVGEAIVNIASITDAFGWNHALPTSQK